MAESQEKSTRSRRNSAMTRRASLLSPAEQAKAIRQSARKPKKAKETRAVGSVKSQVYTEYVKANGVPGVIIYLVTLGLVQFLSIMTNVWLKNWSQVSLYLITLLHKLLTLGIAQQRNTRKRQPQLLPRYLCGSWNRYFHSILYQRRRSQLRMCHSCCPSATRRHVRCCHPCTDGILREYNRWYDPQSILERCLCCR